MRKHLYYIPENTLEAKGICIQRVEDALHDIMCIMSKTVLGTMAPLIVLNEAVQVSYSMLSRRIKIEERRIEERNKRNGNK